MRSRRSQRSLKVSHTQTSVPCGMLNNLTEVAFKSCYNNGLTTCKSHFPCPVTGFRLMDCFQMIGNVDGQTDKQTDGITPISKET